MDIPTQHLRHCVTRTRSDGEFVSDAHWFSRREFSERESLSNGESLHAPFPADKNDLADDDLDDALDDDLEATIQRASLIDDKWSFL